MASLVLGSVGTFFGGPLGGLIGSSIGSFIDNSFLIPSLTPDQKVYGQRLQDTTVMTSQAGANIWEVWGRVRVSTQMIWATDFKETATTSDTGGKGATPNNTQVTEYSYSVSLALSLCEGPIDGIGRVWFDGKEKSLDGFTYRVYTGTETQTADPKIVAVQGADATPAFRGVAYIVFEDMDLEQFGRRIPQITVEVFRSTGDLRLEDYATGFTMIPGTTEFGYATTSVVRTASLVGDVPENLNAAADRTDVNVSLDDMQSIFANAGWVSLVVAWHGTDLRIAECEIRPKVEDNDKQTAPWSWNVGGLSMADAEEVSRTLTSPEAPAVGGAPADRAVYEALVEIKARGMKAALYPFILMDIPEGNGLPDPYGGAEQGAYPWRGRITCYPAPGEDGTPDKTAAAATQLENFVGTADGDDFAWDAVNLRVIYTGPDEWSYRRFIHHLVTIAAAADIDGAFFIGSEMIGLTQLRAS